jgi:hypothetical protein
MDWTVESVDDANHNPEVTVNGAAGKAPLVIDARVGTPVALDATGTRDPDGDGLRYRWFFYPEAGTGIPGRPVFSGGLVPVGGGGEPGAGGIPSGPAGGPPQPSERVTVQDADRARATAIPNVPGVAHVILVVEDDGAPTLTSYRRVILNIQPAARDAGAPAR